MSSNKQYVIPAVAAFIAMALLATRSDAFSPVLPSPARLRRTLFAFGAMDDKGEDPKQKEGRGDPGDPGESGYIQDELTRAREMENSPAHCDFSDCTSVFDIPIAVKNTYGDDAVGMVRHLPALFDQCKQLENTPLGKKFTGIRLPIFILESNKLEGTLSTKASEGETFKFLLGHVERGSSSTGDIHLIPHEEGQEGGPIPWDGEGNNDNTEAWYEQCRCHLRALLMMMDWAKAGEPLTTEKLLLCHNELMKESLNAEGTTFESRYRYRDESVYAGQYAFPVNTNHEENMATILEQLNAKFGTQHPVEWSCNFLLEVLSAHPFLNGNGRMARMCYAYGLVRHGVPCAVVFSNWHSKSRSHYIEAVREAQGQKGSIKRERLYTMGTVGLFATLQNMCTFCEKSSM